MSHYPFLLAIFCLSLSFLDPERPWEEAPPGKEKNLRRKRKVMMSCCSQIGRKEGGGGGASARDGEGESGWRGWAPDRGGSETARENIAL